jgi:hypothetical protein
MCRPHLPRIIFEAGGNLLRQRARLQPLAERLVPMLDLLVTVDWRMSNTARYSDYIFPAPAGTRRMTSRGAHPSPPFTLHAGGEAAGRVAHGLGVHCVFLKILQQRATERGITEYTDRAGRKRRLDRVRRIHLRRRLHEHNTPEVLDHPNLTTNPAAWAGSRRGLQSLHRRGDQPRNGHATDIEPDQTITANTWQAEKQPWPTLTRRIQFYIDHPFFLELGEALPVHKDNPKIGGDYPLK